jgi:hypothetical protein
MWKVLLDPAHVEYDDAPSPDEAVYRRAKRKKFGVKTRR